MSYKAVTVSLLLETWQANFLPFLADWWILMTHNSGVIFHLLISEIKMFLPEIGHKHFLRFHFLQYGFTLAPWKSCEVFSSKANLGHRKVLELLLFKPCRAKNYKPDVMYLCCRLRKWWYVFVSDMESEYLTQPLWPCDAVIIVCVCLCVGSVVLIFLLFSHWP